MRGASRHSIKYDLHFLAWPINTFPLLWWENPEKVYALIILIIVSVKSEKTAKWYLFPKYMHRCFLLKSSNLKSDSSKFLTIILHRYSDCWLISVEKRKIWERNFSKRYFRTKFVEFFKTVCIVFLHQLMWLSKCKWVDSWITQILK